MFAVRSVAVARSAAASIAPRAAIVSSVRTYATAGSVDAKPPVALFGLDGTYASALVCNVSSVFDYGIIRTGGREYRDCERCGHKEQHVYQLDGLMTDMSYEKHMVKNE